MTHELWVGLGSLLGIAFGTLVGVPVAPLYIALGAVWGLWALPWVALALLVSFTLSYLIAASPLRKLVEKFLKGKKIPDLARVGAYKLTMLVRLAPGLPLPAQNYILGLARVPFMPCLILSLVIQLGWAVGFMLSGQALMGNQWLTLGLALLFIALLLWVKKIYNDGNKAAQ